MRETLEIVITETPYGDYQATSGSISVEGSSPEEAEQILREMLREQWESHGIGHRVAIVSDPNEILPVEDE